MLALNSIDLPSAWWGVLRHIMRDGLDTGTEYGNKARFINGLALEIADVDKLHPKDPFGPRRFAEYEKQFAKDFKHGFSYTYGDRLMKYPTVNVLGSQSQAVVSAWAETNEIDQIEYIRKAIENGRIGSRRLQAITWVPAEDMTSEEPPCLQSIWVYLYGDYTLDVHIRYRSWDWYGAAGSNLLAIKNFVDREICVPTGSKIGKFRAWGDNVHVYDYNWDEAVSVIGGSTT